MPALLLTVFVDLIGFGIVLPLQPFYAQAFGASPGTVTLVAASYTAAQFVFAPVWGRVSDRIGRKPVLLATSLGSCAAYLWLAHTDSLEGLFLARAFGGIMAGNIGVAHAYVADLVPPERRAGAMGRVGAAAGLGFVVGPAIGGLLAGADPLEADFAAPFLLAGAIALLAFVLTAILLRESAGSGQRARARAGSARQVWRRAREAEVAPLLLLVFSTPFVFAGIETVFALWSEARFGWGPTRNGYMYTFMGAVAVLIQGAAVGPVARRLGERRTVAAGMAATMTGCLVMPLAGGMAGVMLGLGLIVAGVSVCGPSLSSLISGRARAHERGALLGVSQSSAGLGRILGPALSGSIFAGLGHDWPFLLGAAVMLAAAALAAALALRHRAA